MNIKQLKSIMKEALREVIQEELNLSSKEKALREVIQEELNLSSKENVNENLNFTTNDVDLISYRKNLAQSMGLVPQPKPGNQHNAKPKSSGNPYLDMIAEVAASMTPKDIADMRQNFE